MEQEAPMSTQMLKELESKREVSEACDDSPAKLEEAAKAWVGSTYLLLEVEQYFVVFCPMAVLICRFQVSIEW